MDTPAIAKQRYAKSYPDLIAKIEKALSPEPTTKVTFSGFPANMGEAAVKMTLEALGPVKELTTTESSDGMSLGGTVEFDDVDTAVKAMEKYDGMDMGMGTKLSMRPA